MSQLRQLMIMLVLAGLMAQTAAEETKDQNGNAGNGAEAPSTSASMCEVCGKSSNKVKDCFYESQVSNGVIVQHK